MHSFTRVYTHAHTHTLACMYAHIKTHTSAHPHTIHTNARAALPAWCTHVQEELRQRAMERAAARAEAAAVLQQDEQEAACLSQGSGGGRVSPRSRGAVWLGPAPPLPSTPQQAEHGAAAESTGCGAEHPGLRSWQQEAAAIAAAAIDGGLHAAGKGGPGSGAGSAAGAPYGDPNLPQVPPQRPQQQQQQQQPPRPARPLVWGSAAYRQLWDKAIEVGEVSRRLPRRGRVELGCCLLLMTQKGDFLLAAPCMKGGGREGLCCALLAGGWGCFGRGGCGIRPNFLHSWFCSWGFQCALSVNVE